MAAAEEWSEADIFESEAQAEQAEQADGAAAPLATDGLTLRTPSLRSLHSEATAANSPSAPAPRYVCSCARRWPCLPSAWGRGVTADADQRLTVSTGRRLRQARSGRLRRSWCLLCPMMRSRTMAGSRSSRCVLMGTSLLSGGARLEKTSSRRTA